MSGTLYTFSCLNLKITLGRRKNETWRKYSEDQVSAMLTVLIANRPCKGSFPERIGSLPVQEAFAFSETRRMLKRKNCEPLGELLDLEYKLWKKDVKIRLCDQTNLIREQNSIRVSVVSSSGEDKTLPFTKHPHSGRKRAGTGGGCL